MLKLLRVIGTTKDGLMVVGDLMYGKIYKNENKFCIDFKYTTLQEEDMRFLYEKTTKSLFI